MKRFLRNLSTLQIALAASVAVHAALLTVRFIDPEGFNRVFQDTPLEVILVNAKSDEKPDKATAIAQASLAGGGEAERGRATSPLPPAPSNAIGETLEVTQRRIEALQEQQKLILDRKRKELASMPSPDPKQVSQSPEVAAQEEERRLQLKQLAEIEKRVNEENARPKRRYISPNTREEIYAIYFDILRRRIEDKGTENFPEIDGKKLYGDVMIVVTVNFDGRVVSTEIVTTSGNRVLDRRAEAIARSAGPFGPFSESMRKLADQIAVPWRFRFNRDSTLETRLGVGP